MDKKVKNRASQAKQTDAKNKGSRPDAKTRPTGLSHARITKLMRAETRGSRVAREARDEMIRIEEALTGHIMEHAVQLMKPLAEGSKTRRIKNRHIDAMMRADPEFGQLLGSSARLLKTQAARPRKAKK